MSHVLLVEPDPTLVAALTPRLREAGYRVEPVPDASGALLAAGREPPACVVTESALGGGSGLELCRQLRASPRTADVPIVVTSARAEEIDRVVALEVGADDFVAKPYSVRELVLRIGVHVRRRPHRDPVLDVGTIEVGGLVVDAARFRVAAGGREVALTSTELSLLAAIARRRGAVVTRDVLLREVWELPEGERSRTLDTHVRRIREKLGDWGRRVETIRGVGFRLATPAPRSAET